MPIFSAPAKLNLTLEVLARRPDGYHGLRSLMVPIDFCDELSIEPAAATSFSCSIPELSEENIVLRALRAIDPLPPLAIRLVKHIPVGGGLGGGSSDAAAVLRSAMTGAFGDRGALPWMELARKLGSDVPFFLCGTGAFVEGTGERMTPVGRLPAWWSVVVHPPVSVATGDAYALLDRRREEHPSETRPRDRSVSLNAVDALQREDFAALLASLSNDFQEPILAKYPAVAHAHAALQDASAQRALLSGSGSCVFTLCQSEDEARRIATKLDPAMGSVFVAPLRSDGVWR